MKILVADDSSLFQTILSRTLAKWGYNVTIAQDGDQAWRHLQSDPGCRLAILDWMMPGLDGPEVCRRIRAERKNDYVYVLLMTSKGEAGDLVTGMEAGADDYVTKPFDARELKLRLRAGCRVLESEERYRIIAQTASDGILSTDDHGNIQFANSAAARIFGLSNGDITCRDFESLAPGYLEHLKRRAEKGDSGCAPIELTGMHKSGREMPLEISLSERLEGAQSPRLTVVIRDITERKRTERQLAQSQRLESIGQLAAGIAHEINTPIQYVGDNIHFLSDAFGSLTIIMAAYQQFHSEVISEFTASAPADRISVLTKEMDVAYLRDEIPKAIQQSLDGIKRIAEIVGAMKELSHPGDAAKSAADLNRAIANAVLVSKNAWKFVAEVSLELEPELPLVQCMVGDFSQVMLNLIINAADAIADVVAENKGEKGRIVVSTRKDGDWVEILVSDTGTGIPDEVQPKIFDPFFTTKDVGKGTGQGLGIAHAIIVQKHQGQIQFETQQNVGTTFKIRLPIGTGQAGTSVLKKASE